MERTINKIYFQIAFLIILITIYRNTWLPGAKILAGKENYIIFFLSVIFFILLLDFRGAFHVKIAAAKSYIKYVLVLTLLVLMSTILFNLQELTKFAYLIRFLDLICYFIIYFVVIPNLILNTKDLFRKLVLIISYSGLVISVLGFIFLAVKFYPMPNYPGFMTSIIYHPNYVPFIVIFGIISTIFYLEWQKKELPLAKKYFYFFSIAVQILAVLITYSRQAYLALGFSLMVYFFLKYKLKFLLLLPVFASVFVLIIPYFRAKGFASFISRFYLLIPAYYLIFKNNTALLWGYGLTNTFDVFYKYNNIYGGGEIMNNPHNSFVSLILMFGLPFTVLFCAAIFFLIAKYSFKSLKAKNVNEGMLYNYFVSMIVAFVVLNLFESVVVQIEYFNIQLFLLFLGLMVRLPNYLISPYVDSYLRVSQRVVI